MLGEHTVKLLGELGYSSTEISKLISNDAAVSTKSLLTKLGMANKARIFGVIEALQDRQVNTVDPKPTVNPYSLTCLEPNFKYPRGSRDEDG